MVSLLHTFSLEFLISLSVNMFVEFWLPIKIWNAPFYAPRDHFVTSFACSDIHGDFTDNMTEALLFLSHFMGDIHQVCV